MKPLHINMKPLDINMKPLDINMLSNVHAIEERIKLSVGSDTVGIANSEWTKNLAQHFSLEHLQGSCIGVHASAP